MQDPDQLAALAVQQGLSGRKLWQKGFRSLVITSEEACATKIHYIEANPTRAGLCDEASEYRWSSLYLVAQGLTDKHGDLDLERAIALYSCTR